MRQMIAASLSSSALTAIVLASALGAIAAPAHAQAANSSDGTKLDEIVVTARKRTESIDTVPLAITAMTSAKIEERNLKSIEDVASFSPGFFTQQSTGSGFGRNDRSFRQLTFRGVGAISTNIGIRAGGVAFVDGAPVLNSSLANLQDLDRVEVLKGPQAAYFGRSTFIGAVNYITKDPTDHWTGRASAEYGEGNLVDTSGAVSGPLTDWASFRVSGRYYSKDGQYRTANEQRQVGGQSTKSISGTLLMKPTDNLKIRTAATYFVDADQPPAQYIIGGRNYNPTAANPNPTPVLGGSNCNFGGSLGAYYCGVVPQKPDPRLISANLTVPPALYNGAIANASNIPEPLNAANYISDYGLKRHALQLSNRIDYTFDAGMTLTAVTAYHKETIVTLTDFNNRGGVDPVTGATISTVATVFGYTDHDFSQELRLVSSQSSRFRWVVGGNYLSMFQPSSYLIGYSPLFGGAINFGNAQVGYDKAKTPSAFGGLYFDIIPKRLTLSVEGRYQWDKVSGHYFPTGGTAYVDPSKTFKSFSPRVSLDYKLTPTSTIYALYSRGTKPGGFNGTSILTASAFQLAQLIAAVPTASGSIAQETIDNYEAGIKGSFLNGRLRLALDGYIGRYKGAQVPVTVTIQKNPSPDLTPLTLSPVINIGNVDLKGVEFEAEAIVLPGLRLGGTFAYTDTKITQYACAECSNIYAQPAPIPQGASILPGSVNYTVPIGKRLPGAPKFTYTLSANYEHRINSGVTGYIGGDYIYRGNYFADAANVASSGASKIFNARLGIRKGDYSLELFARNLFNNQSPNITYSSSGPSLASGNYLVVALPDLRRIGVRVSAAF
ncbi:iron complex outermembrane receptor protein [Sphingomonas vulcanisoli]|uniref:Iron complex outermembrane receptor protein n=1 Tax=Sphingomonas vulcanisoli TaxID=1658060 RepID=A0ABX0TV39_9SPHN|nr:TonB-dependent receptor [Sphingomonas vulcanisoli]NIJ08549.1 iron complex outermembrane receptor protein [Sphingomonas vulcanisoli]